MKKVMVIFATFLTLTLHTFLTDLLTAQAHGAGLKNPISGSEEFDDEAESRRLLEIIEKYTDIVTKTRLNADFVPGMVTVLESEDLAARGIRTVGESLNLVPGIEINLERDGAFQTTVRGITRTVASGDIKILLNGKSVAASVGICPTMKMPIEQIDRIEIIRGPCSAIHGEFATAGVVNIVTRRKGNRISGSLGSEDTYGGVGIFSISKLENGLKLNLNMAGFESAGENVRTGPDTLHGLGLADVSNAPGHTNEKMEYGSGIFTLQYKDFSLETYWMESGQGDFFGLAYALPPPDDRIVSQTYEWGLNMAHQLNLSPSLTLDVNLGWRNQKYKIDDAYFYPPGVSYLMLSYPNGWTYGLDYEETSLNGGLDITWRGWDRHRILFGLSFDKKEVGKAWLKTNVDLSSPIPWPLDSTKRFAASRKKKRLISSITFQDEFALMDRFTLFVGIRHDHYDDLDNKTSPRIGGVYRLSRTHIIKAQYAKAFLPPTFLQMYAVNTPIMKSNPSLKPETVHTYEVGYIYNGNKRVGRMTLFYSNLESQIGEINNQWDNLKSDIKAKGFELEIVQNICSLLKLDANLSYVDTEVEGTGKELRESCNWIANMGVIYQPFSNMGFAVQYRYAGDRNREPMDPRDKLKGYHTVDITGSLFDTWLKGLTLRAGIKNLFDEDVRYPAPLESYIPDEAHPSYPEDLPSGDRQWWLQLVYEF